jgi:hypothetical protein
VLAYDRYAYANNNPVNFNDPSGHDTCDEDGNCYGRQGWYHNPQAPKLSASDTWKQMILHKFGVKMSDVGKTWSLTNLQLVYNSLGIIDDHLNGQLKSVVNGAEFRLFEQNPADGIYHGETSIDPKNWEGICFYTKGEDVMVQMNIFHEVGHLLDNTIATQDKFTVTAQVAKLDKMKQ